jgi:hypothetical protein
MKKAASLVFEQVLLFLISVVIFIACFGFFQIYQSNVYFVSANDQTKAVRDMVSSQVIELTRFEDVNSSVSMKIPKRINGESYVVLFTGRSINVTTSSGVTASMNFLSIDDSYRFSGETTSGKGEIIIYKRGYNIILV